MSGIIATSRLRAFKVLCRTFPLPNCYGVDLNASVTLTRECGCHFPSEMVGECSTQRRRRSTETWPFGHPPSSHAAFKTQRLFYNSAVGHRTALEAGISGGLEGTTRERIITHCLSKASYCHQICTATNLSTCLIFCDIQRARQLFTARGNRAVIISPVRMDL